MTGASPHSIEDPAVAASIAALGERWPRIAAAADCPLTEHFIRRGRAGRIPLRILGAKSNFLSDSVIMIIAAWVALSQLRGLWSLIVTLFVVQVLVAIVRLVLTHHRKKYRIKNLREPADLVRDNDPGRLEQLYLANIQLKNLLGAGAALYYHHRVGCAAVRAALLAIAWLVLALVVGLTGHRNVAMIIDACLAVFLIGVGWVVCRPAAIVEAGMRDLFSGLLNRKTGLAVRPGGVLPFFLWPIMACTPIFTAIVYPVLGVPGWIGLTILAWIAEFARLAHVMDHELQMYFAHCLGNGDRMFQAMLSQETSDPLKELELYGRMMQLEHRRKMEKKPAPPATPR